MTDLERLARAAMAARLATQRKGPERLTATDKAVVRALLSELRNPSEGMEKAGEDAAWDLDVPSDLPDLRRVWPAMIDHILAEGV
jgi:hypothetical protein